MLLSIVLYKEDLNGIKADETSCVSAHIDAYITTNAERARDILVPLQFMIAGLSPK